MQGRKVGYGRWDGTVDTSVLSLCPCPFIWIQTQREMGLSPNEAELESSYEGLSPTEGESSCLVW